MTTSLLSWDNCHVLFLIPIQYTTKSMCYGCRHCHVAATAMRISRTFLVPIEPVPFFFLILHFDVTCWTILKTIFSENFFRQLYVKVDRRLDDPTVPKTWTLLETLCQTCLTQEAKCEFIETWDDTCLPLRRVVTRLTRNLRTPISGSEQGDICEECGMHRAYSDFLLQ